MITESRMYIAMYIDDRDKTVHQHIRKYGKLTKERKLSFAVLS